MWPYGLLQQLRFSRVFLFEKLRLYQKTKDRNDVHHAICMQLVGMRWETFQKKCFEVFFCILIFLFNISSFLHLTIHTII